MVQYKYGSRSGQQVARDLKSHGAQVILSGRTGGPQHLLAKFSYFKKWLIEAKASRGKKSLQLTPEEKRRLKVKAARNNAIPVLASVQKGEVTYISVKTGRILKP